MTDRNPHASRSFCGRTRREFLWQAGAGFTGLGLVDLLSRDKFFGGTAGAAEVAARSANPLAPKPGHFSAKAKSVIFLFMYGGPSHMDTFDHKPKLYELDGKTIEVKTFGRGGKKNEGRVVGPKWKFKPYGQCGKMVSDLFPHLGACVDDIAFLHSMTADSPIHGSAMLQMNTGKILSGSPCLGAWANYGLGSENEDLPGFVVMLDPTGGPISGAKNWSSGYMPASYQATTIGAGDTPILDLKRPAGVSQAMQRRMLDTLQSYNAEHEAGRADNSNLAARIASYELAYKMQATAPEATDLSREPPHIRKLYGLDDKRTATFGRQCLMARRLVEAGSRVVQVNWPAVANGNPTVDAFDTHAENFGPLKNLHCPKLDSGLPALLEDLDQRGMLKDTIVLAIGEFGRSPKMGVSTSGNGNGAKGRDHWPYCYTALMAGGGIGRGAVYGKSDKTGSSPAENPVHPVELLATVYHALGIDPHTLVNNHLGQPRELVQAAPVTGLFT